MCVLLFELSFDASPCLGDFSFHAFSLVRAKRARDLGGSCSARQIFSLGVEYLNSSTSFNRPIFR